MGQISNPLTEQVMNMDFSKFIVTTDLSDYYDVEQMRLASLQAKHIMTRNPQTEAVYKEAIAAGHTHIMCGTTRGGTPETERAIIEKNDCGWLSETNPDHSYRPSRMERQQPYYNLISVAGKTEDCGSSALYC